MSLTLLTIDPAVTSAANAASLPAKAFRLRTVGRLTRHVPATSGPGRVQRLRVGAAGATRLTVLEGAGASATGLAAACGPVAIGQVQTLWKITTNNLYIGNAIRIG